MKAVRNEWVKLNPALKMRYHEEARVDKEKYERAMTDWNSNPLNT